MQSDREQTTTWWRWFLEPMPREFRPTIRWTLRTLRMYAMAALTSGVLFVIGAWIYVHIT